MREATDLLRSEKRARLFFIALAQSSFGTGAAYVALLLIAFERFESPLAITIVLVADLLPAMLLGPVFGAAADRWSRKRCMIVADAIRAFAFIGIGVVDSFVATVALAAVAGTGTGIFTPAALAGLPSLVPKERLPAATSLYGAIADLGYTVGPALAALVFVLCEPGGRDRGQRRYLRPLGDPDSDDRFRRRARPASPASPSGRCSARPARASGSRRGWSGFASCSWASAAALFFGGILNVAELLFAEELGAGESGFAMLVALYGLGFVVGSLMGAAGGSSPLSEAQVPPRASADGARLRCGGPVARL